MSSAKSLLKDTENFSWNDPKVYAHRKAETMLGDQQKLKLQNLDVDPANPQGTTTILHRRVQEHLTVSLLAARLRPPTSFPHPTSDQGLGLTLPQSSAHRRRTSNESRRSDSSTIRSDRPLQPAARSATDLSNRPQSVSSATEHLPATLHAQRSNTEPRSPPRASEVWQTGAARQVSTLPQIDSPGQQSQRIDSPRPLMSSVTSGPVPTSLSVSDPAPEVASSTVASVSSRFEEPHVTCARCSRSNIQYEVYKHCDPCQMDLCLRCYRAGRGCSHWFGFGHAAMLRFNASRPQSRTSQAFELPHFLVGRQYQKPPPSATHSRRRDTTSDPASRLHEGNFCDGCSTFANDYFWTCDVCNEGEWGFCNDCVNTNRCCDHPLLPIAHKSLDVTEPTSLQPTTSINLSPPSAGRRDQSPAQSVTSSHTSATGLYSSLRPDFKLLVVTTNCDICSRAVPLEEPRYHCPTHPTPFTRRSQSEGGTMTSVPIVTTVP